MLLGKTFIIAYVGILFLNLCWGVARDEENFTQDSQPPSGYPKLIRVEQETHVNIHCH
jgi:hypothetical protein